MVDGKPKSAFQQRFQAAMEYLKTPNRVAFGRAIGVTSSQTLYNWYERDQRVPDKQRKALARCGISIDWLNDNDGPMLLRDSGAAADAGRSSGGGAAATEALMRTHAFMSRDGDYTLAHREEAQLFADAHRWIASKIESGDPTPDSLMNFVKWANEEKSRVATGDVTDRAQLVPEWQQRIADMEAELEEYRKQGAELQPPKSPTG
ncbi:hypothetical protein [Xanthomonas theicola]|uniref:Uncharacterized protein n=1 Tax=Xanthomonas theicola TaxID=56464 RepID=A0A2S6ZLX4_9XANT|nr:hypothetical protein [Xanthomonas theicola]PPT93244.1 hypothetical protein XthCFBP4691_01130 [Xanthomonas theicola]QNH24822.1 bacteriophage CI repressor [Xanthomonas theicola]